MIIKDTRRHSRRETFTIILLLITATFLLYFVHCLEEERIERSGRDLKMWESVIGFHPKFGWIFVDKEGYTYEMKGGTIRYKRVK